MIDEKEIKHMNKFLVEEVPRSIGMSYISNKIKSCFNINKDDDRWRSRKKKQEKG